MKFRRGELAITIFTLLYLAAFTPYCVATRNYEFLWYIAAVFVVFALMCATLHRIKFDYLVPGGMSVWR